MASKYLIRFGVLLLWACSNPQKEESEWIPLLDADLSKWEPWLAIPHKSLGIPGYEYVENVKVDTIPPLGFSNEKNVFSVIEQDSEQVLRVSGEIFGSLMSKAEYENYHFRMKVKWGDMKWKPMLNAKLNNGLLYHSIGEPGAGLWNCWMTSLEFEIEHTNFGDFISINDAGNIHAKSPATKGEDGRYYFYANADLIDFGWKRFAAGRCFKTRDLEKPKGEWTQIDLICFENLALHLVEGQVVMAVYDSKIFDGENWITMNKGKLQLQSEGAETYFKELEIKELSSLPKEFAGFVKK
ncbi:MAG: DUF1080 domain-containing protein [Bacteroidota bacterium]